MERTAISPSFISSFLNSDGADQYTGTSDICYCIDRIYLYIYTCTLSLKSRLKVSFTFTFEAEDRDLKNGHQEKERNGIRRRKQVSKNPNTVIPTYPLLTLIPALSLSLVQIKTKQ